MNTRVRCPRRRRLFPAAVLAAAGAIPKWSAARRNLTRGKGLVLAVAAAALMLCSGCGGDATETEEPPPEPVAQPAPPPEPPPPPPPKPIELGKLSPVVVDPGQQAAVELQVERNDGEGPIQVSVEGIPEGISVQPLEIPAEESSGKLEVAAEEKLGDEELKATLQVKVKVGDMEAEQPLELVVPKLSLPSLQPVGDVLLQPGASTVVELTVQRDGFEGPLELRVEDLPPKVTGKVAAVAADQSATQLELAAAPDAPNATKPVRVACTLYGRTIDVSIPLRVDQIPYRVQSFMVVTLKPGEKKRVKVPVERRLYKGPLRLDAANMPEGVTIPAVDVAADKTETELDLAAAPNAKPCVRSVRILSTGGVLSRTDPLVVRVSRGEGGFLPKEVTTDPELSHLIRRGGFGGRLTSQSRQALLDAYGGTPESEQAVLDGLRWLAAHQQPDGRWPLKAYSKDIEACDCQTDFEKEVVDTDTAGTAFGVLPFLGAGITHKGAPDDPPELNQYRETAYKGLLFLVKNQVRGTDEKKSGNLGGNLYAHALGTMALCEAYALSGDDDLKVPAQLAIKYLIESQHREGGGWRYGPGQAGDMSATGWMFLAIRCGQLAGLRISRSPLTRAERFVNSCACGPEEARLSRYTYQPEGDPRLPLTAAGLLTRQYLGWKQDDADLLAGCRYLMENLPPESGSQLGAIYYYYYATQVLHHMEGSDFDLWNHRMREHLIRTQQKQGHQAGSWNPQGTDWGSRGGRLYATSMALMTLQVYYRHLPMYRYVRTQQL